MELWKYDFRAVFFSALKIIVELFHIFDIIDLY